MPNQENGFSLPFATSHHRFEVLGFTTMEEKGNKELIDYLMGTIIDVRNKAKKDRNFEQSDAIRDALSKYGITLKDSREGTDWELN